MNDEGEAVLTDLSAFLIEFLGWSEADLILKTKLPDHLSTVLPEYRIAER